MLTTAVLTIQTSNMQNNTESNLPPELLSVWFKNTWIGSSAGTHTDLKAFPPKYPACWMNSRDDGVSAWTSFEQINH